MPDQMCSTFVKITKLSQEERFMCLLLIQSFPRYFLSIPPKIKSSPDSSVCEYTASTKGIAKALTAPCVLARSRARRGEQVFPPAAFLRTQHCWKDEPVPHLLLQWTPALQPAWQLPPTQLSNKSLPPP